MFPHLISFNMKDKIFYPYSFILPVFCLFYICLYGIFYWWLFLCRWLHSLQYIHYICFRFVWYVSLITYICAWNKKIVNSSILEFLFYLITLSNSWYFIILWTGLMRRSDSCKRCFNFCRTSWNWKTFIHEQAYNVPSFL